MTKLSKILMISISMLIISTLSSKAFIMDVWEVRGANPQEVSDATMAFKEKAMANGAKYTAFRSSTKIRGDDSNDTTFVYGYYDSYEDQMSTQALIGANPDWFASTYGAIEFSEVNSVTWANDTESAGEPAAGQTVAYATLEVTSGINFILNFLSCSSYKLLSNSISLSLGFLEVHRRKPCFIDSSIEEGLSF